MKYMLLIYEDESVYGPDRTGSMMTEIGMKHRAFIQEIGAAMVGGAGLLATTAATTVKTVGAAKTIHDGPFAETKEQLGGYYLVDVPDLDAAIAMAKKVPVSKNGSIEIRPLLAPPA